MSATGIARTAWSGESGLAGSALRTALLPASALFRLVSRAHHAMYDAGLRRIERAPMPVFSVGNLRVGGAGKTPFARWLVERLLEEGRTPAVLHGGYGSDEPALHRRWHPDVPVIVGRDRAAGARTAAANGRDVVVLDDGFQHRRLARDLDIVLLAAEHRLDRIRLLPRGPWREPLAALRRADLVIVTRKTAPREQSDEAIRFLRETVERRAHPAWIRPADWNALDGSPTAPPAGPVTAVASTAEPESFFATLAALGVPLAERLAFPDHHDYAQADAERILARAGDSTIVTTEKDAVKLDPLLAGSGRDVRVLGQAVVIEDGADELMHAIREALR